MFTGFFLDTAEDSETCTFNGKVYQKGESFKKECNTCFCGGGNVIGCTLKMCQVKEPGTIPSLYFLYK